MAILSISSEYGTGALEIGREIRNLLNYEYIGLGRLLDEAKKTAEHLNLYTAKGLEMSINAWGGNEFMSFMALLHSVMLEHASKDNVILLTRGSNYLVKGILHALGIRIVAPLEYRIERLMKKEKVTRDTARLLVKQADREIACAIQIAYGKGLDDPEAYDIKFDTSTQKPEEITEIVKNLLLTKDTLKTTDAQVLLQMKALSARIKAKVFVNPSFYTSTLELDIKGNGILLKGVVRGKDEQNKIERELIEIAGSVPLICDLKCQSVRSELPHLQGGAS